MNKLAVQNNGSYLGQANQSNPLGDLPRWLGYLVSSYPNSKLTDEAFMVMEDQFSDYDHNFLFAAARSFVKTDDRTFKNNPGGFPTASEFWPVVRKVEAQQAEQERETQVTAFDAWFERCQVLRVQRLDLLEDWYTGAVTDHQLSQFADEMHAVGLESAAASLRSKLQ